MGEGRKLNLSPEERERRRQRALELHQQVDPDTGRRRFGGPQPGSGRPRTKRAAELVAEAAQQNANLIIRAFRDALQQESPIAVRVQAARQWLDVENREAELQLKEEHELAKLEESELRDRVAAALQRLAESGALAGSAPAGVELVVEGRATELEPRSGRPGALTRSSRPED